MDKENFFTLYKCDFTLRIHYQYCLIKASQKNAQINQWEIIANRYSPFFVSQPKVSNIF